MIGRRFGRLVVLEFAGSHPNSRNYMYRCRCDCGNETIVAGTDLDRSGSKQVRSCGCYWREVISRTEFDRPVHQMPEYASWTAMLTRCLNPNQKRWSRYGGRGIRVCVQWRQFRNFYADMGPRPEGGEIHRIDNDGNYEPGNCEWLPMNEHVNRHRR